MTFVEICTGVYQTWDSERRVMKTTHMLYGLTDQGEVFKNTKDGWVPVADSAQKDEAPW